MKKILLLASVFALIGCCRKTMPVRSETLDSVRIENRTEYIERVRWDTVTVEIPAQSAMYTGPADNSYLETDYASSVARILDDGSLYHDLCNKPQKRPVTVPVVDTERTSVRDSIVIRDRRVEVPVRMPMHWWQKFLMWSGVGAWGITAVYLCLSIRHKKG